MKKTRRPQEPRRRAVDDDVVTYRDLPPKLPGEHRWSAVALYTLTLGQARASMTSTCPPLDRNALTGLTVECIDCELTLEAVDEPCTAEVEA